MAAGQSASPILWATTLPIRCLSFPRCHGIEYLCHRVHVYIVASASQRDTTIIQSPVDTGLYLLHRRFLVYLRWVRCFHRRRMVQVRCGLVLHLHINLIHIRI